VRRAAAFFDVDGTLVNTNIVHQYVYIRSHMLPAWFRPFWMTGFYAIKGPYYLLLDHLSRSLLNGAFYRSYAGLSVAAVRGWADSCCRELLRPRLFEQGSSVIAEHRAAGRLIVLVTGSIDFLMAPLAEHLGADDVLAPGLVERGGRFTGQLDGPPLGEAEKASRVRAFAESRGLDLSASYAYGDSIADLPMLECVGHPHVVNPDKALASAARRSGWSRLRWAVSPRQYGRAAHA